MTNPFPFTSGNILNASELNAIGDWTAFTPTWGNVTLGGSGTTNGVGTSPRSIDQPTSLSGWCQPTGASIYNVSGFTAATGCFFYGNFSTGASGWSVVTSLNATQPATWDANGMLNVSGWYELT